ncbi:MAG: DNA-binding response regulator [Ferruginibacter sp.]|nr:DNA-binding response regulator [Ferruginibacter sp.]
MNFPDKLSLAFVDDHTLFRKGMISLVEIIDPTIKVIFEADNGLDLQQKIDPLNLPDIILMDVNMPHMDGFKTVEWLNNNYPDIKVLVLSMIEQEETIIRMLKLGVKGYLSKDVEPAELKDALAAIIHKGFYYTDFITGKLVHTLQVDQQHAEAILKMSEREKKFLELACSELTYSDIAQEMFLSPKTIDGYRNNLFEKLKVKSRVGLALYAVKHGMVKL